MGWGGGVSTRKLNEYHSKCYHKMVCCVFGQSVGSATGPCQLRKRLWSYEQQPELGWGR